MMNILNRPTASNGRITRRDFLKVAKYSGLSILVAGAAVMYPTQIEPVWWDVTQIGLALPHLPTGFSGFRFVQISDLHLSSFMTGQRIANVFEKIKAFQPSLVTLTGDYVVGFGEQMTSQQQFAELEAPLKALASQIPTLAVLGNHDHYFGANLVNDMFKRCGVHTLANNIQKINIGSDILYFAGLDDVMEEKERIEDVIPMLPEGACAILMVHEPDFADTADATGRFDLQISGHSHGGQVNLPFMEKPYYPDLAQKYPKGIYKLKNMYQYTNRGIGMSPPFVRFNCRPEITIYQLVRL